MFILGRYRADILKPVLYAFLFPRLHPAYRSGGVILFANTLHNSSLL